jgi:hypothetical protein
MDDYFAIPTSHNAVFGQPVSGAQEAAMNSGITPVFFLEPVTNPRKSAEAGRPICDDEERVRLFVAGDPYNQVVHPVNQAMRERFPDAYRAFKEKREMHIEGTPIRQWALLTPANIAEFEAIKIFSVEGLAQIPDSSLQRVMGLREWREKAKAWLATAKDSAAAVKYAEENVRLNDEIGDLKRQMAELGAQVAAMNRGQQGMQNPPFQAPVRRGPGRPRNNPEIESDEE